MKNRRTQSAARPGLGAAAASAGCGLGWSLQSLHWTCVKSVISDVCPPCACHLCSSLVHWGLVCAQLMMVHKVLMSNINFSVTIASLWSCQLKWFVSCYCHFCCIFCSFHLWGLFSVTDIIIITEAAANFSFPRNFHTIYCFLRWLLSIFCLTAKTAMSELCFDLCPGLVPRIARHNSRCENGWLISFYSWHRGLSVWLCSGSGLGTPGTGQWSASARAGDTGSSS